MHVLIFLHLSSKHLNLDDIGRVISTEKSCPRKQPQLYHCVKEHMIHGAFGLRNKSSSWMKKDHVPSFILKNSILQPF